MSEVEPYVLRTGEFRPGTRQLKVASRDTGNAFSLGYSTYEAGAVTPLHIHRKESEFVYLLDGKAKVDVGDESYEVGAGDFVHLPAGVKHRLHFLTDGHGIAVYHPGANIEAWSKVLRRMRADGMTMAEAFKALPPEFGIEFLAE